MEKRCQYPETTSPIRCQRDATFRVRIGIYAGAWWVCEEHVDPVLAKADGLSVSIDELDAHGCLIEGTHRYLPGKKPA